MELTPEQVAQYDRDGYLIFPELFSAEEIDILTREVERLSRIKSELVVREGEDDTVKIMFRLHEEDGETASPAFRAASRTSRVLRAAQQCLHDDVYMHHSKLNMKAAIEGSAWPWHQDFHSWHLDGIATPDMATMTVVLTEASELNGCMYVLPGSHKEGRSDPRWDDSTAYNLWVAKTPDMKEYMQRFPKPVSITGAAGTAAIFHCNLLHASGHNLSPEDRWQIFFCFNQCKNRPVDVENPRPDYVRSRNWTPLTVGPEDGVIAAGRELAA
jgi:ectoine hydroxylase